MTEINTTIQLYRAAFCSTFTFSIVKYIRYNVDYHYSTVFVRAGFIIVNSWYKINTFTLCQYYLSCHYQIQEKSMLLDVFSLINSIKCIRCDAHIMWADRKFNPMFIFFKKALSILLIKLKPQPRGGGISHS